MTNGGVSLALPHNQVNGHLRSRIAVEDTVRHRLRQLEVARSMHLTPSRVSQIENGELPE